MLINKNCNTCKGVGKITINQQIYTCPDCDFRDKLRIASLMKEDKIYDIPADRLEEMQQIAQLFSKPGLFNAWHIILLPGNKIRKVDWSWME